MAPRADERIKAVVAEGVTGRTAADLDPQTPDGAAEARVEVWSAPGASHTDALSAVPGEWEESVVGFLDGFLLDR